MRYNRSERRMSLLRYCYLMNYCKNKKYRNFESILYYTENLLNSLTKAKGYYPKTRTSFKTLAGFEKILLKKILKHIPPRLTQKQREVFLNFVADYSCKKGREDFLKCLDSLKNTT
jgi:RecG-like helicase